MIKLLPVMLFATASSITPGPNNIMIMTSGLNFGIKRTLPHYLGICLGFPLMVIAVGLGFGALFTKFPVIHETIKMVGIVYMLYLAWQVATASTDVEESKAESKPLSFLQGAMFQWVNPKAWVMGIGAVSAYTSMNGSFSLEVLYLSLTFLVTCILSVGAWMYFGAVLQNILKNEKQQRYFNYAMGGLLAASIVLMAFE